MQERLEQLEESYDVEWRDIEVKKLFRIENTLSFNKNELVPVDEKHKYAYVTRTSINNGILDYTGFVNKENLNDKQIFSLGLLQMDFFYQKTQWYAGQFVRKVIPKFEINDKRAQYFLALLNKLKPVLLKGLVRDVDKTFLSETLYLPTKKNTKGIQVDFDFIEDFIQTLEAERLQTLEAERLQTLEAYLMATGLKDTTLTDKEQKTLEKLGGATVDWREFPISKLFNISTPKKKFNANTLTFGGEHPYIARGEKNNGVRGYIDEDEKFLNSGNTISFGQDTATMFYQKDAYFTGDKIKIFTSRNTEKFDKFFAWFYITAMRKSFSTFSWGSSSFNVKILEEIKIKIPTKNGQIDHDYMVTLMRAMQKIVIQNVVAWADKRIEATREIIEK